jgi:hypothetical protein
MSLSVSVSTYLKQYVFMMTLSGLGPLVKRLATRGTSVNIGDSSTPSKLIFSRATPSSTSLILIIDSVAKPVY